MKLIFPGTFDPFTIGHADVVNRALKLCDSIIIAIGVNEKKKPLFPIDVRIEAIRKYYASNPKVSVISYNGLTADLVLSENANAIVRGVRTMSDYESERTIADVNMAISGVDTIFLLSNPSLQHISSSMVKELIDFGHPVDDFVIDTFPKIRKS